MNRPSDVDDAHDIWGRDEATHGIADVWGEASEPVPHRVARRPDWLAPAFVIVLATTAFAVAWLVTRGGGDAPRAATPSVTTQPGSTPAPTSSEGDTSAPVGSSSGTSSTTSSSSSSGSASSASFPADAKATCGSGQAVPTSSVRLAPGTTSTCPYVAEAVAKVNAHLMADAGSTQFTIEPWSAALGRVVPLSCTRQNHLSYCTGGSNVRLWVSDTAG